MATNVLELINIGELPNDGTGDPLRVAFQKINTNFESIPLLNQGGANQSIQFNNDGLSGGTANLLYDTPNNTVRFDTDLVPITTNVVDIGSNTKVISNIWLNKLDSFHLGNVTIGEINNILNIFKTGDKTSQSDLQVGNIYATGEIIAIGNVTSTGDITINGGINLANIAINTANVTTTSNAINQVVYQLPQVNFTTLRLQITSHRPDTNDSQSVSMTVNKRTDGIQAKHTVFGTVFNGTPLTRYNADISFGNVRIMVSPIPNVEIIHLVSFLNDVA
jgi:cyclophilin family peptidyl-prolyl cis-trans isomerase